jgi:hypothetical protein
MGRLSFYRLLPGLLGCFTLGTGVCTGGAAQAAESECPRLSDVVAGLGQVLTTEQVEDAAAEIVLRDQGADWSIEVRGQISTYSDPVRNCAERARVATVFAALALEPIDKAPAVPAPAERPTGRLSLEAGPQLSLAALAQGRNTPVGWGGQARLSRTGEHLGGSLGLEAAAFSKLDLGWYGASITRAACDLSGRVSFAPGSFILAGELGPYLAFLRVRGTGLRQTSSVNRMDVGGRVGLTARLRTRLAPFLAVQAELGVRRFDLMVNPSGNMGTMPRLWLGFIAGGALDL